MRLRSVAGEEWGAHDMRRRAAESTAERGVGMTTDAEYNERVPADANAATVLVIEDNPDLAYLWERYLEVMGCRAVSTPTGGDAIELAQRERPAAVILDIMLPGKDGWTVLSELKSNHGTCEIPVVLCSALDEQARGVIEGADAYMRKPVTMKTFMRTLSGVGVL